MNQRRRKVCIKHRPLPVFPQTDPAPPCLGGQTPAPFSLIPELDLSVSYLVPCLLNVWTPGFK